MVIYKENHEEPHLYLGCGHRKLQQVLAYSKYSFYFAANPTPLTTLSPKVSELFIRPVFYESLQLFFY